MISNIGGSKLALSFISDYSSQGIFAVQGETARTLTVQVVDDAGVAVNTTGLTLELYAPDGEDLLKMVGTVVNSAEGIYSVKLAQFKRDGLHKAQFVLKNANGKEQINSKTIDLFVETSIANGGAQGQNIIVDYQALSKGLEMIHSFEMKKANQIDLDVQTSRIDNLIKNASSATNNAELTDIRIDSSGYANESAGGAVRSITQGVDEKLELTSISPQQLSGSSHVLSVTQVKNAGGKTIAAKLNASLSGNQFAYIASRITKKAYQELKNKKIVIGVTSLIKKDTRVKLYLSNSIPWGSVNGAVGAYFHVTPSLNAENQYRFEKEIDLLQYEAKYTEEIRRPHQGVWLLAALQDRSINPNGNYEIAIYCYEKQDTDLLNKTYLVASHEEIRETKESIEAVRAEIEAAKSELEDYKTKTEQEKEKSKQIQAVVCWGDSLTAGGGWQDVIKKKSKIEVINCGVGGEDSKTIMTRQGANVMMVNNLTIPASNTIEVKIASRATDRGIMTADGTKAAVLLQGGGKDFNPVAVGDVEGTLRWSGTSYADPNGEWFFKRSKAGQEVVINRPTAIRTKQDILYNKPENVVILFIGQNGGYANIDDLIQQHRLMITHSRAKAAIIVGLSSGTASSRQSYEVAMKKEFGRYFISLREYLSTPIMKGDQVSSCYGLEDAGLTATENDIAAIKEGRVPPQLLSDAVHYTAATKKVIGELIYKRMQELNLF